MIRDPEHEKMPRRELEQLQLERLKVKVREVYEKVPYYRQAFKEKGVTPDHVQTLADLVKLPFTSKLDFRDNYPFGLMAVPHEQVVRIHSSSGTTGKPIIAPYTQGDIDTWAEIMARTLAAGGTTKYDVMQNAYGYGLFTGGLGFHYGAERLGCTVIPTSGGNTKRQILLLQDLETTVITCTPSYALILCETALDMGVDLRETKLRLGFMGAEPWSEQMRKDVEERMGISAINIYGLTEIIGPGVSVECTHKCGMHIAEDHFLVEIINPKSGEQIPYGEEGELVITTLTKEAQPVLRFRTRDIVSLNPEPCECGRTLARMSRVTGRSDDMLIVRGVNVFPSQIESVLLDVEGVEPHYLIVVDRQHQFKSDELEVWIEVSEAVFSDEIQKMEDLEKRLRAEMDSVLGISARIKLVEPRTIARTEGKAKRVVDRSEL
ncbi:MAG: phenylacetate--CoA ligase [Dehalococcoidia bacterium]|nr:MAG: phenylacetate--CoA ligase [Dehalococcoidia bacterium]UCG82334.1 MAG: phenylacetate--CoA ligase [Dehalococcoidia bacterium]